MNLFRITDGPWEKLFSGVFQEHDIELYSNPEKVLLSLIYEKKLDMVEGAIVEVYRVFNAKGEVEAFTETLPREALIITKHDEHSNFKFLLLGSRPTYVKWSETEFADEVDGLLKRLSASATMMKEVSKAYELELEEIWNAPQEVQAALFSQPLLVPIMASSASRGEHAQPQPRQMAKGDIILGITRDRNRIIEPLALFMKTIVTDGEAADRNRVLQVIGESALLSNVPVVFLDFDRKFIGIGEANKDVAEIRKYDVNVDPMGFPTRLLRPRESVRVDLNLMSPEATAELFGIGEKDFPRILAMAMGMGQLGSMNELIERVSNIGQTEEFSEFKIRKAARLLKLMDIIYPNLFGGTNDIGEMAKQGLANIARASVVVFESVDERMSILLFHSLAKGVLEYAKARGKAGGLRILLVIPHSLYLKRRERRETAISEILLLLNEAPDFGVCYAIAAETQLDMAPSIKSAAGVQINVVSGNDVGVQLANRKAYRVLVRPTLSRPAA